MKCPICGSKLEKIGDAVYQCPVSYLFFKLRDGKLTPPTGLLKSPIGVPIDTPNFQQNNFDRFLQSQFAMSRDQYNRLTDEEKKRIRLTFLNWVKKQAKTEKDTIASKEELFAWWLKNKAGFNIWQFEDFDPRTQQDLRQAFYKWAEEEGYI